MTIKKLQAVLVFASCLIVIRIAFAAWTATDDFDGYTTSADLDTQSGGANWAAAWAKLSGGAMTIETAPAGGQGGKAVRSQSATVDTQYDRTITAITAGTMGIRMRCSITNPNDNVAVKLKDGAVVYMAVRFGPTGNFEIFNLNVYESMGVSYSVDTWYTVEIDFDDAAQPNLYRARINGGTYTAYKTVNGGDYAQIDRINLDDSATNAHTAWFDDIGLAGTPPAEGNRRRLTVFGVGP